MRILPGLPLVWRDLETVQIGLDPRTGTVLRGLSNDEQLFLSYLTRPHSRTELLLRAHQCKVGLDRMEAIVDALSSAGLVEHPQGAAGDQELVRLPAFAVPAGAEAESKPPLVWMPMPVSTACVYIARLDSLGVEVALTLARMGIGSLAFGDTAAVGKNDHPALARHWRGTKRARAMEYLLKREFPQLTLHGVPDIAVVTGSHHIDPLRAANFMALPHMLAFVEEVDTYVGPLVVPGQTPCARCMYYNFLAADPAWAHIAPQLRHSADIVPEASTRRLAGSLIARAVGIFLAYGRNCLPYHSLTLAAHEFTWKRMRIHPSAECGCMSPLPGALPVIPEEAESDPLVEDAFLDEGDFPTP